MKTKFACHHNFRMLACSSELRVGCAARGVTENKTLSPSKPTLPRGVYVAMDPWKTFAFQDNPHLTRLVLHLDCIATSTSYVI